MARRQWRMTSCQRSSRSIGGRSLPVSMKCRASRKTHGFCMAARPIITPETAVSLRRLITSRPQVMSPLPMTGMRTERATASITFQSASPPYPCARVRPCTVMALMPLSSRIFATSTALIDSESQPVRIFAVTGTSPPTAWATPEATSASTGQFFSNEDPPFLATTLFTGQPKLMSMKSGFFQSMIFFAASPMRLPSAPKSCTPTGR